MKKVLKNAIVTSIIGLVLYFAMYILWALLSAFISSQSVKAIIVALITSTGYCVLLMYFSQIRGGRDREVFEDYKETKYGGIFADVKRVWKREAIYVYVICAIAVICYALTALNGMFFDKSVISMPTVLFLPIVIINSCFKIKILGYIAAAAYVSVIYLVSVLIYRNRQYKNWEE